MGDFKANSTQGNKVDDEVGNIASRGSDFDLFSTPRFIRHDGLNIALYEAGPKYGYPLILMHGWPEIGYSWKHIMPRLAGAGYRVIVPDMRGYGHSSAPKNAAHYGISEIVSDIEAILDDIGAARAVLIGHDWGGIILWHAARMLRSRVSHLVSLCTPHVGRAPIDPIEIFKKRYGAAHYFVHFNERPGEAEMLFSKDPESFFRFMFRSVPKSTVFSAAQTHIPARFAAYLAKSLNQVEGSAQSPLLTNIMPDEDLAVFAARYEKSGFHGGLNYYRNTSANWKLAKGLSAKITQPCLMISARQDLFLPPEMIKPMVETVQDLQRHVIEDAGHWLLWEAPDETAKLIIGWLGRRLKG